MNNQSPSHAFWFDGIALVRIVFGIMLIQNGLQVFNPEDINVFSERLEGMSLPYPEGLTYAGKTIELGGGLFLMLGLFTRLVATILFVTFIFITFAYGDGKIFGENQLPFLYSLMTLVFFLVGPGKLSIDYILFVNKREHDRDDPHIVNKKFGRYVSKS